MSEPTPLLQVARYRGTAAGWQNAGAPRTPERAAHLIAVWRRIDPTATLRAA